MSHDTVQELSSQNNYSSRWPRTFRSLRHRNYRLWFFGQGISLIGSWMQTMAQQVLVYRLTGSATSLGIISFIGLIPLIPLSLWSGSLSDRISKRTLLLITQVIMLVQALILAILTWTNLIQVWHVYVLAFLMGAAQAMDTPARQAFTVEMVEGKEDLSNAIGLNSAMFNMARALGPSFAGILVAATGEGNAFFINAFSFVAVIISLLMMRELPQQPQSEEKQNTLIHTKEGIRFVKSQPVLLVLTSLIAVSAFLSMPYSTLMPVFASNVLGKSADPVIQFMCNPNTGLMNCRSPEALPLGILLTTLGIGSVLGALFIAAMSDSIHRGAWLTAGNIAFPLLLLIFSVSQSFLLSLVILIFVGFSFVCQNALANTLMQFATPDSMRGRVMSLYSMTFQGMMRLGGLQAGLMADWLGAPLEVGITSAISLLFGIYVAVRFPKVRKL